MILGINWYHTHKPEEHANEDGKYIGYLDDRSFVGCDDGLLESLRAIISAGRSIAALERASLFPKAEYYGEILRLGSDHSFSSETWLKNSLKEFTESDIIFCDPDDGLIVKSVSLTSAKSDKYVTADELISYYSAGKSVIFYNHRCREKEEVYLRRFRMLRENSKFSYSKWMGLKFRRGTIRDYFFILQPYHVGKVTDAIENMLQSNWQNHFSLLNV